MEIKLITVLIVAFMVLKNAEGNLCGNTNFGTNNVDDRDDTVGPNTGFGYQMRFSGWIVNCCGIVDEWVANVDLPDNVNSQIIYFQVWRLSTGSTYTLVGQNPYTVTQDNDNRDVPIDQPNRITVIPGDIMGWWTSGYDIIRYDNNAGNNPNNYMRSMSALTSGQTLDWGAATLQNGRTYGIRMEVRANNNPSFTNLPASVSLSSSDQIGTSVYKVSLADIDTYDVSTLSVSMTPNSKYTFDPTSHIVTTAASLQSSAGSTHTLTFTIKDQCNNTDISTLTVYIVNQLPVIWNLPASTYVSEDVTFETLLHTINATDPDGAAVTCDLAASVPAAYPFVVRQLPSSTAYGIYTESNPLFSYTTKNQYAFSIDCSDGMDKDTDSFTVYLIQNVPPVFMNLQNATVISSTTGLGASVFTVKVNDTDDVSYALSCDTPTCPFVIFDSGEIFVTSDLSTQTVVGYDLHITVSDGRNSVGPKTLTVTIADLNDPVIINNLPSSVTVAENTAVGTSVFVVSITDLDVGQFHTYSMTSSPSSGLSYFRINSTTGVIQISGAINYDALASTTFVFTVTASDPVTSSTKTLTVQITNVNEAPSFGQASYSLSAEEGSAGDIVGTPPFGLSDPDTGDTKILTLDCGTSTGYFSMNSNTGTVTFQSDYDLDTGLLPSSANCTVTVTDSGGLKATANLLIRITDANDNIPIFSPKSYSFHISYYAAVSTLIGIVTAKDDDAGSYGVLTFSLDQSSLPTDFFAISNTGEITLKKSLRDSALSYGTSVTLTATASDIGGESDTASVIIVISDTTTTSTTTTTDRYRTFIEDTRNIAWLAGSVIVFVIALAVLAYVVYTCHGPKGCAEFKRTVCNRKRYRRQRINPNQRFSSESFDEELPVRRQPIPTGHERQPPPPKEFQFWRTEM